MHSKKGNLWRYLCELLGHNVSYGEQRVNKLIIIWWNCSRCHEFAKIEGPDYKAEYLEAVEAINNA